MPKSQAISLDGSPGTSAPGELLSSISNRMVQLHKHYYGKGPTKARSYVVGDLVVCLMRGGFTKAEETLIANGRAGLVHEQRGEFQAALKEEFVSSIEEVTGRRVVAFMSNTHDDPPLIVEMFVLEPSGDDHVDGAGPAHVDGAGPAHVDGAGPAHVDGAGPDGAGPA